jgi:hypothetical protein
MPAIFPRLVVGPGGILVDEGEWQLDRPAGRYVGLSLRDYKALDEPQPDVKKTK